MGDDFRPNTPKRFGRIPVRYEHLQPEQRGRALPTTKGTNMPRIGRKAKPQTPVKVAPTNRKGVAKPTAEAKPPKRERVRITGPRFTPLTDYERLTLYKAGQREWKGDARDVATWTPCRVCGGPAGTSAEYVAPFRRHRACRGLSSPASRIMAAAREVLGLDLTREDAHVLAQHLGILAYIETADAQPVPVDGRRPRAWGHLDQRALKKAISNLPTWRMEAGVDPAPCADGPCCWCGVRLATGWVAFGHRWADGSKAPLCGMCSRVMATYGNSPIESVYVQDYSTQRRLAWCALTGTAPRLGINLAPSGYRTYAEVAPADHPGHDERGGYIAADQRPGAAEYAERVERENAEALARAEARRAEQAEAEQAEAQRWGFGVTK